MGKAYRSVLFPSLTHSQDSRSAVRLDGRVLFIVGPLDEQGARSRAQQIERRLATLLRHPATIPPVRIQPGSPENSAHLISVAGVPVVTVTEADAEDHLR